MAVAEVLQAGEHVLGLVHEVGQQHHEPAPLDAFGQLVQRRAPGRVRPCGTPAASVLSRTSRCERTDRAGTKRQRLVGEQQRADGVLLTQHQVGERRRQRARVFELGQRGARRLEAHRARQVEQQVAAEVRLLGVLLHEVAVALGEHLPVEVLERIARHVRAVLGELDAEAVEGRAVHARDEALDHEPRAHVEVREPRDHRGIEVTARVGPRARRSRRVAAHLKPPPRRATAGCRPRARAVRRSRSGRRHRAPAALRPSGRSPRRAAAVPSRA